MGFLRDPAAGKAGDPSAESRSRQGIWRMPQCGVPLGYRKLQVQLLIFIPTKTTLPRELLRPRQRPRKIEFSYVKLDFYDEAGVFAVLELLQGVKNVLVVYKLKVVLVSYSTIP